METGGFYGHLSSKGPLVLVFLTLTAFYWYQRCHPSPDGWKIMHSWNLIVRTNQIISFSISAAATMWWSCRLHLQFRLMDWPIWLNDEGDAKIKFMGPHQHHGIFTGQEIIFVKFLLNLFCAPFHPRPSQRYLCVNTWFRNDTCKKISYAYSQQL